MCLALSAIQTQKPGSNRLHTRSEFGRGNYWHDCATRAEKRLVGKVTREGSAFFSGSYWMLAG